MEMSISKYQDTYVKHENNFEFTMDYDSGYVSHNPESNLDSSSESLNEKIVKCMPEKPIYLSEDALLEIPEIRENRESNNLSLEIDKEDYEETRKLFNSPFTESSTVVTNSTESHEMNYSGFCEASDESDIEIPNINQIIIDNLDTMRTPNSDNKRHSNGKSAEEIMYVNSNERNEEYFKGFPTNNTAFHNITNTLVTNDPKKKLTLIFSKCDDKENVYSVKRKYRSMTPDTSMTPEKFATPRKLEHMQSEQFIPPKKFHFDTDSDKTDKTVEENNDIYQLNAPFINSLNCEISEAHIATNEDTNDHSFKFCSTMEKSQEEYKTRDSNLLSECLKNFGETCFVNEDMYIKDVIKNTRHSIESPTPDRENIQGVSKNPDYIQTPNIPEIGAKPVQDKETTDQYDEIRMNVHEKSLKQDEGSIDNSSAVLMELKNIEPTVPISDSDTQRLLSNTSNSSDTFTKKSDCQIEESQNTAEDKIEMKFIIPNKSDGFCSKSNLANETISTPKKKFKNSLDPNLSPDLFGDEDMEEKAEISQPPNYIAEERFIIKKDRAILRRASNNLKGVIPPHSMTVINISVDEILNRIEHNGNFFWKRGDVGQNKSESDKNSSLNSNTSVKDDVSKSLLVTSSIEELGETKFPDILEHRCHGLYFNRSKLSEEFEELCVKYSQRYVGAETQSSCTVFESNCSSPMKRKQIKQRWAVKSPGRRLSHLAKRRITFSSAILQTGSTVAGSRARQILVDAKKLELLNRRKSPRKTPKKTPGKSPRIKTRTPSSSAKKKLALRFRKLAGEIEKTVSVAPEVSSKRALFQSPERDKNSSLFLPSTSAICAFPTDAQKPSTKRALFLSPSKRALRNSPFKRSPFKRLDLGEERKRKRSDSDDVHPSKISRSLSMDVRPSGSETKPFNRAKSDMSMSQTVELSAVHKKKLQWAVYEALRSQSITAAHPQFKLFASILARVTRRFLPNLNGGAPRAEGSTSDRMLRIARHHVYAVLKGKSVDEIYNEFVRARARSAKPHGYVGPDADLRPPLQDRNAANRTASESAQRKVLGGCKPSVASESKIDRIRKVINFGDDNS